jgi:hypothetical protein
LGEDVEGNLGAKNKAYLESRVKLLESGGKVIKAGGAPPKKWQAKGETKGYNNAEDFVEAGESKKKRQRVD